MTTCTPKHKPGPNKICKMVCTCRRKSTWSPSAKLCKYGFDRKTKRCKRKPPK